ncbi:MAG TPA: 2-dehydropantoate 2-reductase [Casimicrobiaceae bacterium]|nr:2-dehydropantoate 2-reductase [Casimicrobiaceae bacterium]
MKIAVIGAGGVGGYFGGKLAQAGHDVTFVARGRHLDALRSAGLRIESGLGNVTVERAHATNAIADVGPVDVTMFCVKLWDVESTAPQLKPLVANGGVVIPFQNGVESHDILRDALGDDRVLGGVAYIAATIREPGVIAHTGTMARLTVGAFEPKLQPRAEGFAAACKAAGFDCEVAADIGAALWKKYVFLAAMAGCTSLTRSPVGVIRSDPDIRATMEAAMREIVDLARARGVELGGDFVAKQLHFLDSLPEAMRSSMLNDLMAGNRLEAPWLSGGVARMAREAGVAAPVNATIYAALKPFVAGVPKPN